MSDRGAIPGLEGPFLIEPKPTEPMKHLCNCGSQMVIGFLRHHGLDGDCRLNIEANAATLAGHSFAHDIRGSAVAYPEPANRIGRH